LTAGAKTILSKDFQRRKKNRTKKSKLGFELIKHSSELDGKVEYSKKIPLRGLAKTGRGNNNALFELAKLSSDIWNVMIRAYCLLPIHIKGNPISSFWHKNC
jgi:hypothetical protein